MSCRSLKFVQTVHRNVQKHLAPLRFFLHVSEQLPSADLFRDLLYLSGGTSYNMFLDPKQQNKYHLPNATALVDLLAQDPVLLQVPLVRWTSTLGTKMLMGADAIPQLLEELERDRAKGIGIDNAQILHRLAHNSTSRFKHKLVAAKGPKVMKAIGLVAKLRTGEQI
jgi:hypothetical protein